VLQEQRELNAVQHGRAVTSSSVDATDIITRLGLFCSRRELSPVHAEDSAANTTLLETSVKSSLKIGDLFPLIVFGNVYFFCHYKTSRHCFAVLK
jgi:hypothetical protein